MRTETRATCSVTVSGNLNLQTAIRKPRPKYASRPKRWDKRWSTLTQQALSASVRIFCRPHDNPIYQIRYRAQFPVEFCWRCRHFCSFQPPGELKNVSSAPLQYGGTAPPPTCQLKPRETAQYLLCSYRQKTGKGSGKSCDVLRVKNRPDAFKRYEQFLLILLGHQQYTRKQSNVVTARTGG